MRPGLQSIADIMAEHLQRVTYPCSKCGAKDTSFSPETLCNDCDDRRRAEEARLERARWAPPMLRWATGFDVPEIGARVKDPKAVGQARAAVVANPRSIILIGAAGVGKSSLAVAIANELTSGRRAGPRPVFVDALALATARQRSKLGEEAEEVSDAMSARTLVLDELGRGRPSPWNAIEEVLFHRYNDNLSTIFTTPAATIKDLDARLADDGVVRRVFEDAVVISMTKGGR